MATRRATAAEDIPSRELSPSPPGSGLVFSPDDDDPVAHVRQSLALLDGGECKTKVYRLANGEKEWLYDTTFAAFDETGMSHLQTTYGGGKFQLYVYGPEGLIGRPTFRIGGAVPAPSAAPVAAPSELMTVLSGMVQMQRATLEALERMSAAPVAPPPDPMARVREMAEMARLMRDLNPPPPPPAAAVDPSAMLAQMATTMKTLKDIAREVEPEPPADNPMALAGKGLDLLGSLIAGQNGGRGLAPSDSSLPSVSLPASLDGSVTRDASDSSATDESDAMNPLQKMVLRGHLLTILQTHAKGDASGAAEYLIDKLPDEAVDYLKLPNWFEILSQIFPDITPHKPALTEVRDLALSRLE